MSAERTAEIDQPYEEYVVRLIGQRVFVEGPSDLRVEMDRPDPITSDLVSALVEVLRFSSPGSGEDA